MPKNSRRSDFADDESYKLAFESILKLARTLGRQAAREDLCTRAE
jgi:hypothetical protein